GLGSLGLADMLAFRAWAAGERKYVADKSVVFLFLNGGPAQHELFDPKMTAPADIRSVTGEVQTKIPGVTFGGSFPKLAALADKLAVVRSFRPGNANHDGGSSILTCGNPLKASLGGIYARLAGNGHPVTGLPSNVFLSPMSVGREAYTVSVNGGGNLGFKGAFEPGALSTAYTAFHPTANVAATVAGAAKGKNAPVGPARDEGLLADMKLRLPNALLDERIALLKKLDDLSRNVDKGGALDDVDKYREQAYQVLLSGVSQAFDLSKEDAKTLARYDTGKWQTPPELGKRLTQTMAHTPTSLGKQMLLARRVCEAGCGFVTVGITGWDMHGNNGFGIKDGFEVLGPAVDHALSTFLQDVAERGLSEKILLVVAGEMGRTPKIVAARAAAQDKTVVRPGRDHWANLGALLLAGGGLKMGQVIGQSDKQAGTPATEPITPANLLATIMHTLFDVGELRVKPGLPVDAVRLVTDGKPIRELI
ncbi:hypothetical protein AYO44_14375, partial [Planctomycetaceae bacterium SCGC AG-212-F19]